VQTLDDGAALLAGLERLRPQRAVVMGGGYIGVEMSFAIAELNQGSAPTGVAIAARAAGQRNSPWRWIPLATNWPARLPPS
jgi:NADPH-dependent 2,4-dienoyl-CoA reductase/sulfur reductase-like enzyme